MNLNFTYSNFIYLDTNIISYIIKNETKWSFLQKLLILNDLCIAISDAHFAELYDFKYSYEELLNLFQDIGVKLGNEIEEKITNSKKDT